MARIILGGDVGGTKIELGLFRADEESLAQLRHHRYVTHKVPSLEHACSDFLGAEKAEAACFGVAGAVISGHAIGVNVPWQMDEQSLSQKLGGAPTHLINDLEATAYGILGLPASEVELLQQGEPPGYQAPIAVIAAGTGLGEAFLVPTDYGYRAVASEGGHADFAPRGDEQLELLRFLAKEFGHVSAERVLSGPGLYNIYRFLRERMPDPEPQWLTERMRAEDHSAAITEAALVGRDPRCVHALDVFVEIYAAEAANLVLKVLGLGGVFIGGGIAPHILPILKRGRFVECFAEKGRFSAVLKKVQIKVSLNPGAALLGAAHHALEMLSTSKGKPS